MRFSTTSVAAATFGAASLVSAMPLNTRQTTSSACANITQEYQQALAANATSFSVDGEVAYNCLNSMPFDSQKASDFIEQLSKYMQYQSTIEVLKNPPKTYLSPAVDLLGGLERIYEKANTSQYQSQYQFDTEISNLVSSANDGHLSVGLCSLAIFSFSQEYQLVSISPDGLELPQLYTSKDAALLTNGSKSVSTVTQINGQNALEYLQKIALGQPNQDPDAQWNDLFPEQAKRVSMGSTASLGAFVNNNGAWPGSPITSFTFANGSTVSSRVRASVRSNGFNFTSGQALYNKACLPISSNSTSTSSSSSTTSTTLPTLTSGPRSYPTPVIRDSYNHIVGYYLDGHYNDTAVLFVPTFSLTGDGLPDDGAAVFAEVSSTFVSRAVADGKTKMVIDLSGNPGGDIVAGFSLFKLFFPDLEPYSATRMRDHKSTRLTMKSYATLNGTEHPGYYIGNPWLYETQVTPDQNGTFDSWEDLYGPEYIDGANLTSLYANFNYSLISTEEDPLRGYGGVPLNVTGRPFKAEDILIVTDGFCTSTCTTFVTLMTNPDFGGVKSVAFGGRPINEPMQIMGGVRGAQSMEWDRISSYATGAYINAYNQTNSTNPPLTPEEFELFGIIGPSPLENFPLVLSFGNLNLRNAYLPGDDETPLQFAYQAADCKLFYTYENIIEPGTTWPAAAEAMWGNASCVSGSRPSKSGWDSY